MKKFLNRIFIDGLTGMAHGLFATLIVGTIIQQIGLLIGGNAGDMIYLMGKMAAAMTGAGIGVGVACRFKESTLVTVSAGIAGNLHERIVYGFVRDYFQLNFVHFPIFNISDIFINIGVIALVILILIKRK